MMISGEDVFWHSSVVRKAARDGQVGTVVRMARERRAWSQDKLAALSGYSRSTISRLEGGRLASGNLPRLRAVTQALGMPQEVFAVLTGMGSAVATTVSHSAAVAGEDDPMRRRSLIAASGLALPLSLLARLDDALAVMPPTRPADLAQLLHRLGHARTLYDDGRIAPLVGGLPDLLASAHTTVEENSDRNALIVLSAIYGLAADALNKVGIREQARLTADRAVGYAERSEDPIARAAADRHLAIVLRHEDRHSAAQELTLRAAARVEKTGLRTRAQSAAYAQMLCTAAYSAAQGGERASALEMMKEANRAARLLPSASPHRPASMLGFTLTTPEVRLYEVGVLWSLGDAGRALATAQGLRPEMFPTAERRGRFHTDLARAWWQRGRPEETSSELLSAIRQSPAEVRDRPAVRAIADQLISRHRLVPGVRELAGALGPRK